MGIPRPALTAIVATLFFAVGAFAHGISEADQQAMLEGGNLRYLWLGAIHMLTGYDHLLFLFGVIFFLTGFKDILKFITAFTVGHSITLILATFLEITADYFLVDAVIALTVCYKGFDNLDGFRKYLKINPPNLLFAVFLFGLIHGFGLSTRLQQLPLGHDGLLLRILSFNVGVELGQVMALSVLIALLAGWRRTASFGRLAGASNMLLIAAGLGLFIFQVRGYLHGGGDEHHHEETQISGEAGDKPAIDSTLDSAVVDTPVTHTHSHGHGHSHGEGHGHGHSHDYPPKAKKPRADTVKPHSHHEGIPHGH